MHRFSCLHATDLRGSLPFRAYAPEYVHHEVSPRTLRREKKLLLTTGQSVYICGRPCSRVFYVRQP